MAMPKKKMGRPKLYTDPKKMQKAIDKYFKECKKESQHLTMSGLALALGMDRASLVNYAKDDDFFDTVNKARQKVEIYLEQHTYGSAVAGVIFNLKNNFGWKDKTEQDINAVITPKGLDEFYGGEE